MRNNEKVPLGKHSFCPVFVALPLPRMFHRPVCICKADKVLAACSSHVRQEKNAMPQKSDSPHSWLLIKSLNGNVSLSSVPPSPLLLLISFFPLPLVQSWRIMQLLPWQDPSVRAFPETKVEITLCVAGAGMWVGGRCRDSVYCLGTKACKAYWYFFLGDIFCCPVLCSTAYGSKSAQLLVLIQGLSFLKGIFAGFLLKAS